MTKFLVLYRAPQSAAEQMAGTTAEEQQAGMDDAGISRVIQGLLAGIGFIGGGTILKLSDEKTIKGVTTAAALWVAAAVGVAAGLGRLWSAFLGSATAFLILSVLGWLEHRVPALVKPRGEEKPPAADARPKERITV